MAMNCNDCGTLLKPLFGAKWYCPNDCDRKPKNIQYETSLLPMWESYFRRSISITRGKSFLFFPTMESYYSSGKVGSGVQYKVLCGSYRQELFTPYMGGGEMIKLYNISETDTLILVSK